MMVMVNAIHLQSLVDNFPWINHVLFNSSGRAVPLHSSSLHHSKLESTHFDPAPGSYSFGPEKVLANVVEVSNTYFIRPYNDTLTTAG